MAGTIIYPTVGKLHYDQGRAQWKLKATELREAPQGNTRPTEALWFDFLVDALSAMLTFWAMTGDHVGTASVGPLGDVHAFAAWLTATFPKGVIGPPA
jgi:hypothetical protein